MVAWVVLLLPFLPLAWDRVAALINGNIDAGWLTPISLNDMLGVLFIHFAVNRADPPWETLGTWWMGGLFLLGLWPVVALGAGAGAVRAAAWAIPGRPCCCSGRCPSACSGWRHCACRFSSRAI